MPSTPNITVASQVACTDTPHGPCRPSTGMASRVNAASQPKTATAQATPMASVRPSPCTSPAPAVTTRAAATAAVCGRVPSSSGPTSASTAGTQATATPRTAGSACRDPSTSARLNTTRPVTAMPDSHSHSALRGQVSLLPVIRASATRIRQAIPYRTASAVYTGAPASTEETATLPPTQTMAAEPAATPAAAPRCGAEPSDAGLDAVSDAALDAALGAAAGTDGAPAGRPGTSGARRPGTTLRYWSDGPANRAIVADL